MNKKYRRTQKCPENCRYRSRLVPFCGYCMMDILNMKRDEEPGTGDDLPVEKEPVPGENGEETK